MFVMLMKIPSLMEINIVNLLKTCRKKCKVLKISAEIESQIAIIEDPEEKKEFLNAIGLKETSLSKLVREGYELLDLITFFTSGEKESRAWSCKIGTSAPEAATKTILTFRKGLLKLRLLVF